MSNVKCIEVRASRNEKADYAVVRFAEHYDAGDKSFNANSGKIKQATFLAPKNHSFVVDGVYTGARIVTERFDEPQWEANDKLGIKAHQPLINQSTGEVVGYYRNRLVRE